MLSSYIILIKVVQLTDTHFIHGLYVSWGNCDCKLMFGTGALSFRRIAPGMLQLLW